MSKTILLRIVVTLVFLTVTVFSPLGMMGMEHHHDMGGGMSNCPFMVGEVAMCQMNALDHIASWQAMFTTLPAEFSVFVLLLLALVLSWVWLRHLFDPPDSSQERQRRLFSDRSQSPTFATLLLGSAISPRAP